MKFHRLKRRERAAWLSIALHTADQSYFSTKTNPVVFGAADFR
ncbi:hypothetical protein [Paenibacillus sp. BAC0078]